MPVIAAPSRYIPISLLLLAALFILVGYDSELPVLDTDEGILLAQTFRDRNLGEYQVMQVQGYPPLILGLYHAVQRLTEFVTHESVLQHSVLVIRLVRLLAAAANLVTAWLIYRIGTKLESPLVGCAAALVWVVLPSVHEQMALALTEPWQAVFITAAIWMLLKTLETRRWAWAVGCTLCGLLAVTAKYSAFPALGFGVGATLWLAWAHRRTWLWTTLLQLGLIALTAYLLLKVYGAQTLLEHGNAEPAQFARAGLQTLLDISTAQYLFNAAAAQIGLHALPVLLLVLLVGTLLVAKTAPADRRAAWGLLLVFWAAHIWFVSSFLVFDHLKERYFSPSGGALVVLIAISLMSVSRFLSRRLNVRQTAPFLLLWGAWLLPPLVSRSQHMLALTYPYADRAFVEWSSASLEAGTMAITGLEGAQWHWRYFNPIWGDYHGPQRPLVDILHFLQQPRSVWEDSGIQFVQLSGSYPGDYPPLPFDRDDMLFLKAFPPPNAAQPWRGDTFYIYRLQPIQHLRSDRLGDRIALAGYDLDSDHAAPGENLAVRLYWRASALPDADYHLYLHLSPLDAHEVIAQADGTPALPGRPTTTWNDPFETLISPQYHIAIPGDLPPGEYRLLAGLYRFETGERLLTESGEDFVLLSPITVLAD